MLVPVIDRLAEVSYNQSDFAKAEMLCRKVFYIQRSRLGADHSDTSTTAYRLAKVCHRRGNHEQAESFYKQALDVKMRDLGTKDPQVIALLQNYASLLTSLHRDEEAQNLLKYTLLASSAS